MIKLRRLVFLFLLFACSVQAQQDSVKKIQSGIFSNPKLLPYKQKAFENFSSAKNKYALEDLKQMDAAADSLFVSEMQAAERDLKQKQEKETSEQSTRLAEQNHQITAYTNQNEVLRSERNKLWRKAIVSIVVWLVLVALYLAYKMRMFSATNKVLTESKDALTYAEKYHAGGEQLLTKSLADEALMREAEEVNEKLIAEVQQPANAAMDGGEEVMQITEEVKAVVAANRPLGLLSREISEDRKPVDVNALCENIVAFGNNGIETEEGIYHFTITKDLEKRLPMVRANEEGLARVLVFLISNALNACYRHSKTGLKGYKPKVTVSTRVLPRFVQVKVKDNGTGVKDEMQDKMYEAYFTTEIGKKAGLGLALSKKIIEQNKGEMKIESSLDRGTDVTIKLFFDK